MRSLLLLLLILIVGLPVGDVAHNLPRDFLDLRSCLVVRLAAPWVGFQCSPQFSQAFGICDFILSREHGNVCDLLGTDHVRRVGRGRLWCGAWLTHDDGVSSVVPTSRKRV